MNHERAIKRIEELKEKNKNLNDKNSFQLSYQKKFIDQQKYEDRIRKKPKAKIESNNSIYSKYNNVPKPISRSSVNEKNIFKKTTPSTTYCDMDKDNSIFTFSVSKTATTENKPSNKGICYRKSYSCKPDSKIKESKYEPLANNNFQKNNKEKEKKRRTNSSR